MNSQTKTLVIFDFDHTFIDCNSDTWFYQLLPTKDLPKHVHNQYVNGQWNKFMGIAFQYMGDQGIKQQDYLNIMKKAPLTKGMLEFMQYIEENPNKYEIVIMSDSNSLFIDWILQENNMKKNIHKIFTNPAYFDESGFLRIQPYKINNCTMCPSNICKGFILEDYLKENSNYNKIYYIGDGSNDFHPLHFLRQNDIGFVRKNYGLEKTIQQSRENGDFQKLLKSKIFYWEDVNQILDIIKKD